MSLHQAIRQHTEDVDDDDTLLVGYTLMSEHLKADGRRQLKMTSGGHDGHKLPAWQVKGYLTEGRLGAPARIASRLLRADALRLVELAASTAAEAAAVTPPEACGILHLGLKHRDLTSPAAFV